MITFITNRTLSDITKKTKKAFYNYTDLNRIQEAINYIAEKCEISVPTHSWGLKECCDYWKFQYYILNNIDKFKQYYPNLPDSTPRLPTILNWNYQKANDIEKILKVMYETEPVKINSVSFNDDSWETINLISKTGAPEKFYNIGDTKIITTKAGKQVELKLYSFDTHNYVDGITHLVIGLSSATAQTYKLSDYRTSQENNFNWENSNIRITVLPEIFNDLPDDLQNAIKEINRSSLCIYQEENKEEEQHTTINTYDKLWLPSDEYDNLFTNEYVATGSTEEKRLITSDTTTYRSITDNEFRFLNTRYWYLRKIVNNQYQNVINKGKNYFVDTIGSIKWLFCI